MTPDFRYLSTWRFPWPLCGRVFVAEDGNGGVLDSALTSPPSILRLTDIASAVDGDWTRLARTLGVTECDISHIRTSLTQGYSKNISRSKSVKFHTYERPSRTSTNSRSSCSRAGWRHDYVAIATPRRRPMSWRARSAAFDEMTSSTHISLTSSLSALVAIRLRTQIKVVLQVLCLHQWHIVVVLSALRIFLL